VGGEIGFRFGDDETSQGSTYWVSPGMRLFYPHPLVL
jgi:hypothetical protein